jgi:phage terminase large subunit-like protein
MAGLVVAGQARDGQVYVAADHSTEGGPAEWARAAVAAYHQHHADQIVAEKNQGGDMVQMTLAQVDSRVPVALVWASRGKQTRAQPVVAAYEQGRVHHVGTTALTALEDELCLWTPLNPSPNRLDALVWAVSHLLGLGEGLTDIDDAIMTRRTPR